MNWRGGDEGEHTGEEKKVGEGTNPLPIF